MADNAQGFAALDAMLDSLRRVESLGKDSASDVADALHAKVEANVAAQQDAYGHDWFPSKLGAVLKNAAAAVSCVAKGDKVVMVVSGVEARHHVGSARGYRGGSAKLGGFRRSLIPFKSIPGPMKAVIREVLVKHFNAATGGK
jgi:hypothetical protein